jgi:hypothetical protein
MCHTELNSGYYYYYYYYLHISMSPFVFTGRVYRSFTEPVLDSKFTRNVEYPAKISVRPAGDIHSTYI